VAGHYAVLSLAIQLHMCSALCEDEGAGKKRQQAARAPQTYSQTDMFTDRHINKGAKLCALMQAVNIPGGFDALAAVANQMIVQSSCSTLAPIIQAVFQMYPTIQDLNLSNAQLAQVQQMNPQLVSCIVSSIA